MKEKLHLYQNKDRHPSYNFWRTRPSAHWPFGKIAGKYRFFQIPDDIDDSALAHFIMNSHRSQIAALKEKMIAYANVNLGKHHRHTFQEYRHKKIYNTFFIKNMPCGFDYCALANVMYLFYKADLLGAEEDEDSLYFLRNSILSKQFANDPDRISPYYPDPVIILYHAARAHDLIFSDEKEKAILRSLLQDFFETVREPMRKLMMASSLYRLGVKVNEFPMPSERDLEGFVFFIAGLFGEFDSKWIRSLHKIKATRIQYHCKAFSQTLLFEYLVLKRSFSAS